MKDHSAYATLSGIVRNIVKLIQTFVNNSQNLYSVNLI